MQQDQQLLEVLTGPPNLHMYACAFVNGLTQHSTGDTSSYDMYLPWIHANGQPVLDSILFDSEYEHTSALQFMCAFDTTRQRDSVHRPSVCGSHREDQAMV